MEQNINLKQTDTTRPISTFDITDQYLETIDCSKGLNSAWNAYRNYGYNIYSAFNSFLCNISSPISQLKFVCKWIQGTIDTKRQPQLCPDKEYCNQFEKFLLQTLWIKIVSKYFNKTNDDRSFAIETIKHYGFYQSIPNYIMKCIQNENNIMDKKELQLNQQNNYHNDTYNNGDNIGKVSGNVTINNNNYYTTPVEKSTCKTKGQKTIPQKTTCPVKENLNQLQTFKKDNIFNDMYIRFDSLIMELITNGLISDTYKWNGKQMKDFAYFEWLLKNNGFFKDDSVPRQKLIDLFGHNFPKTSLCTIVSSEEFTTKDLETKKTLNKIFKKILKDVGGTPKFINFS